MRIYPSLIFPLLMTLFHLPQHYPFFIFSQSFLFYSTIFFFYLSKFFFFSTSSTISSRMQLQLTSYTCLEKNDVSSIFENKTLFVLVPLIIMGDSPHVVTFHNSLFSYYVMYIISHALIKRQWYHEWQTTIGSELHSLQTM